MKNILISVVLHEEQETVDTDNFLLEHLCVSMSQEIIINSTPQQIRVALLEEGLVAEVNIERRKHRGIVGNIYKGRVTKVLPGMQAAFCGYCLKKMRFCM